MEPLGSERGGILRSAERFQLLLRALTARAEHLESGLRGSQSGLDALDRVDGQADVVGHRAGAAVEIAGGLVHRAEHAGQRRHDHERLLHSGRQTGERVNQRIQALHHLAQRPLSALADGNHQGFHRTAQILQISLEIVVLRGGLLGGVAAFGYGLGPLVDTGLAGLVQVVRGLDRVTAEDGRVRLVALLVGQVLFGLLQLAGEVRHADEMMLGVICADA